MSRIDAAVTSALAALDGTKPGTIDVLGTDAHGEAVLRYDEAEPLAGWTGSVEQMCLYAGQGCGLANDVTAADLVAALWVDAVRRIPQAAI